MATSNIVKQIIFKALALCLCTIPVAACILSYFPLWVTKGGGHVLSGFAVLLCVFAFSPVFNFIKGIFKSPASYTLWFAAFILFLLLSKIADEMTVISFVGFIGNLLGAVFFRIARKYELRNTEQRRNTQNEEQL